MYVSNPKNLNIKTRVLYCKYKIIPVQTACGGFWYICGGDHMYIYIIVYICLILKNLHRLVPPLITKDERAGPLAPVDENQLRFLRSNVNVSSAACRAGDSLHGTIQNWDGKKKGQFRINDLVLKKATEIDESQVNAK